MKFTQPYDSERIVPSLGEGRLVKGGETVDVPAAIADTFDEAGWAPADPEATALHDQRAAAREAAAEEEAPAANPADGDDDDAGGSPGSEE